jgi:hypothetical protein
MFPIVHQMWLAMNAPRGGGLLATTRPVLFQIVHTADDVVDQLDEESHGASSVSGGGPP